MLKEVGRPEFVFCQRAVKHNWLRHEVLLTSWLLKQECDSVIRGYDVNPDLKPDAEMYDGQTKAFIEMDTGEVEYKKVAKRMKQYEKVKEHVIWVTLSPVRMEGLMKRCTLSTAIFTMLGTDEWFNRHGEKI